MQGWPDLVQWALVLYRLHGDSRGFPLALVENRWCGNHSSVACRTSGVSILLVTQSTSSPLPLLSIPFSPPFFHCYRTHYLYVLFVHFFSFFIFALFVIYIFGGELTLVFSLVLMSFPFWLVILIYFAFVLPSFGEVLTVTNNYWKKVSHHIEENIYVKILTWDIYDINQNLTLLHKITY